jgi:alkaline phosphatase D
MYSNNMKRRDFLLSSMAGLAIAQFPAPLYAGGKLPESPFKLGIASGDVTDNAAVLWTRLVLDIAADDGGMPHAAVAVTWEVSAAADMGKVIRRGEARAIPQLAHSVHVDIDGLEPDQAYWYRFSVAGYESVIGRTRTLPDRQSEVESLRFVTASCQNFTHGHFVAYDHIVADAPDFIIHLGDYIYDKSYGQSVRRHDGDSEYLTSLADFRRRHALYKTDIHLRAAHAQLPFLAMPDNHDATYDGAPETRAIRAAAYQAWYEHMPTRGYGGPGSPDYNLQRSVQVGALLQLSLLDTRQFRDDHDLCPEDRDPDFGFGNFRELCPDYYVQQRSMLGSKQEAWLEKNIRDNSANWHAIASTGPVSSYQYHKNEKIHHYMGSWDAYPANRKRLTGAIAQASQPTVILSGDVHSFWAIDGMQMAETGERFPAVEFVTSSISADWPEPLAKPVRDNRVHNPQLKYYGPENRGYLLHEVTAQQWQTTARAVEDVTDPRSGAFDLARFTVEHGESGFELNTFD